MTNRERQFLTELARGRTQNEIARLYGLHIRTVEESIKSARSKLSAKTTTQAVVKALARGLLDLKGIALVVALCWSCLASNVDMIRSPLARTQTRVSRTFRKYD